MNKCRVREVLPDGTAGDVVAYERINGHYWETLMVDVDGESKWLRMLYNKLPGIREWFIGQTDKNGDEIYEGDICENGDWCQDANAYDYRTEEVVYDNNDAMFIGWNPCCDGMTCKIIGSIHDKEGSK